VARFLTYGVSPLIRLATLEDTPAIVRMVAMLHASAGIALPIDPRITASFVDSLIASPMGLVLVGGPAEPDGFLAASVGAASIAMTPVAHEHGWWSEGGDGLRLLRRYEQWAREMGCFAARMSTPPGATRANEILERSGFAMAEQAWVKVL
jgi:N-acetylglutamate synthase-like GNAT family acetyltransferase